MNTVESIKYVFVDAGAEWVLWLLAGLSVASVAIALERWFFYRRAGGDLHELAAGLQQRLAREGPAQAATWLEASASVAARVAAAGLWLAERGPAAANRAMVSRTALEREQLDRRLAFLGTLGNNAPFIGLFGTVIGVIQAFEALGDGAMAGPGAVAAGQVASGAVMSAIAEALVATAIGIAAALPAVAAYNYLQRRVEQVLGGVEVLSNLVLAYLESEGLPCSPGTVNGEHEGEPSDSLRPAIART